MRFPEFSGEWEKCKVSDILDFYPTNSLSWEQLEYKYEGLYNLHYGLIHNCSSICINTRKIKLPTIKENNIPNNYTLCKNGDVAFADASEDTNDVAKCIEFINCNNDNVVCGLHTVHGRDNSEKTIVGFKGYAFSAQSFRHQIRRLAQGTKIYSINSKNFSECYIGIPSKEEQTKVSNLLYIIDERIQTQKKIIDKYESLIKGIIDSAFNRTYSINSIGNYVCQIIKRNKKGEKLSVLSISNKLGFIEQIEQFSDRVIASDDTSNYKIISSNDFAYNPARINVGSIARLKNKKCGIVSPMYICFRIIKEILPEYLELYFNTKRFANEVDRRLEGSVRLCLSYEALCEITIPILPINEQKLFTNKLTLLYSKINIEKNIAKDYLKQKQYLLYQMFI